MNSSNHSGGTPSECECMFAHILNETNAERKKYGTHKIFHMHTHRSNAMCRHRRRWLPLDGPQARKYMYNENICNSFNHQRNAWICIVVSVDDCCTPQSTADAAGATNLFQLENIFKSTDRIWCSELINVPTNLWLKVAWKMHTHTHNAYYPVWKWMSTQWVRVPSMTSTLEYCVIIYYFYTWTSILVQNKYIWDLSTKQVHLRTYRVRMGEEK